MLPAPLDDDAAPPRPRRRDAVLRREALLNAAIECFSQRGFSVPLEDVADLAGVGRGTLYRNFKDRIALMLAIIEREIEQFAGHVDGSLSLEVSLRRAVLQGARISALFARMAAEVQLTADQTEDFRAMGQRAERALEPLAARCHAEGTLSTDVGARELMLATRMLSGLCKPFKPQAEIEAELDAGMVVLLRGLAPK